MKSFLGPDDSTQDASKCEESPATQAETLECVLTIQQGHRSYGNTKLHKDYEIHPRPWLNARVVFNPHLVLFCCFQVLNQITPALVLCRFLTAMFIHFFWCVSSSQRRKICNCCDAPSTGTPCRFLNSISSPDCHCSSVVGITEDASQAVSKHTNFFRSFKWPVQPESCFPFPNSCVMKD